jgi:uncharacterized protein YozE (UPF0346 family)
MGTSPFSNTEVKTVQTYFISNGIHVKIGKSHRPSDRYETFQTASAEPLSILLTLPGNQEAKLHQQFAADHIRGEWFSLSYSILKFISIQTATPLRISFYDWLKGQRTRLDDIGRFAVIVCSDRAYPRRANQWYVIQQYYPPKSGLIAIAEQAHNEWRKDCEDTSDRYLRWSKNRRWSRVERRARLLKLQETAIAATEVARAELAAAEAEYAAILAEEQR